MRKENGINPAWQVQRLFATIAMVALLFIAMPVGDAQDPNQTYKVGDRVEVRRAEGWLKGEVVAVDDSSGRAWYTISYEWEGAKYTMYALPKDLRPLGGAARPEKRGVGEAAPSENKPGERSAPPGRAQSTTQTGKYKIGDRVECDITESGKFFEKGTIAPFPEGDKYNGYAPESGYYYRVKLDRRAAGGGVQVVPCKDNPKTLRPLAGGAPYKPETTEIPIGPVTTDENNTLSADRPILECPVKQPRARNGARPDPELLKKVLRCQLGERPAAKGLDGAITIDVTAIQVGTPRPWNRLRDMGGGTPGVTIVYPVKATYTEKTFYRSQTVVGENWIRIFNFFVNSFGEWQYGSAEPLKMPDTKNIPREQ